MTPGWVIAAFGGEPPPWVHEVIDLEHGRRVGHWTRTPGRGRPCVAEAPVLPGVIADAVAYLTGEPCRAVDEWIERRQAEIDSGDDEVRSAFRRNGNDLSKTARELGMHREGLRRRLTSMGVSTEGPGRPPRQPQPVKVKGPAFTPPKDPQKRRARDRATRMQQVSERQMARYREELARREPQIPAHSPNE